MLRLDVEADDVAIAEIASAEAFAAGATGMEEREGSRAGSVILLVYSEAAQMAAVHAALAALRGVRVSTAVPCDVVDWSLAWKAGLGAIVVSDALVVRPSWVSHALVPGQTELEIDPGQAFGTGGHESTRIALDLIAATASQHGLFGRVLDVGTGSGVLALAALRLGADTALGVDTDAVAVAVAQENAQRNGMAGRISLVAGSLDALEGRPFDLVVANLLKRELLPLVPALARHFGRGTRGVVSGLLRDDLDETRAHLIACGIRSSGVWERSDSSGTIWAGLLLEG